MASDYDPPSEDRGSKLIAIFWTTTTVATVVVGFRCWGRVLIRKFAADDYVMLFTWGLFVVGSSLVTRYATLGGGRHSGEIQPLSQFQEVMKFYWINQPFFILGFATAKCSIGLLILRLMGSGSAWQKWALWFAMLSCLLFNSLQCIFTFAQCTPPHLLWSGSTEDRATKCWNPNVFTSIAIFVTVWGVVTDLAITILPITMFWHVKIHIAQKIGLCCLQALAIIVGAIKIQFLSTLRATDPTWGFYNLITFSAAELFVLVVCGSIPPLKPFFRSLLKRQKRKSARLFGDSQDQSLTGDSHALPFAEFRLIHGSQDVEASSNKDLPKHKLPPAAAGRIAKRTEISVSTESPTDEARR